MRWELRQVADLSADERSALRTLSLAVYPPEVAAAWPGRAIEWAPHQCGVIGWDADGAAPDLYLQYHDKEWGVPVHHDRTLFEFLVLEGAQAGLSWETILKKRGSYRDAFDQFDPAIIAKYGQKKCKSLLANAGIVRNRLKIEAAIQNAKVFLAVQDEFGTFDKYIWGFACNEPKQNAWKSFQEVPAKTPESDARSKDLKRRGFKFVGSTICYAFMQAVGMVNDHLVECFRHGAVQKMAKKRRG